MKAARRHKLDTGTPWERLSGAARALVYEGDASFAGINGFFEEVESYRYKLHVRVFLSRYRSQSPCPTCHGARLKPAALAVRVGGLTIAEFAALTVDAAARLLADLTLTAWEAVVAREILRQLNAKLGFLLRVGLGYLTLSRQTRTLSGGEAQRINLANQLGSQLVGTLYVLDEPSIGLHPRDTMRLVELCHELAPAGNTLVGAREHNLKDVTVRIPLHTLTVVSGVSGSGKSTLVHDTLYRAVARAFKTEFTPPGVYDAVTGLEYLKGVRLIDQEPIGRTPRSNPVTYVKAFDEIRKLYAAQPRSRALGLDAGAFSFNVPGGRCESCQGDGFQKLEMYFFEDVYVTCQECEGRRYRPDVLTVKYRGRAISDVLHTTLVVEHHLDVIKSADYVIDLGPEGGDEGGETVAEGTPEAVAQTPGSYTGKFLAEVLPKLNGKNR